MTRPHPALLRVAEGLIIAGGAVAAAALVARLAHVDRFLLRLLEGSALLLAAGAYLAHLCPTAQHAANSSCAAAS